MSQYELAQIQKRLDGTDWMEDCLSGCCVSDREALLEAIDAERFVTQALNRRLDVIEDAVRQQRRRWFDPRFTRRLWRLVQKA